MQLLVEVVAIRLQFCLGEAKVVGVNVVHMVEHAFEQDFVLVKFDATEVLDIDPESMIGFVVQDIANRKVVSMGDMG
jgi:hypothetical protein